MSRHALGGPYSGPDMWRIVRRVGLLLAALACVTAGCSHADPSYGAAAGNRTEMDLLIREGMSTWRLPAMTSGIIFMTLGLAEDAPSIEYEILDERTCRVLGVAHVEFAPNRAMIVVDQDGSIETTALDSSMSGAATLVATDACPGPAEGQ